MNKSITVIPKKRGRPATGRDPLIGVRLPPNLLNFVEEWARRKHISRSQALREIFVRGIGPDQYINCDYEGDLSPEAIKPTLASDILSSLNQGKSVLVTNTTLNYILKDPTSIAELNDFSQKYLQSQWVEYEHISGASLNPFSPRIQGVIFYR